MPTVHHEAALEFLGAAQKGKFDAGDLRAAIDAEFPGWGTNAVPTIGYSDPGHHVSLIISRTLHDTLPGGAGRYSWDYQHGFNDVMRFLESNRADDKAVSKWLDDAVKELIKVMAG